MKITTQEFRVEVESANGFAVIDARKASCGFGFVAELRMIPDLGCYWLAVRSDDPRRLFLLIAPSDEWLKAIESGGYTVIQDLAQSFKKQTIDTRAALSIDAIDDGTDERGNCLKCGGTRPVFCNCPSLNP